jgi:hypothetical protein
VEVLILRLERKTNAGVSPLRHAMKPHGFGRDDDVS